MNLSIVLICCRKEFGWKPEGFRYRLKLSRLRQLDCPLDDLLHAGGSGQINLLQDLAGNILVGAGETDDNRDLRLKAFHRLDNAVGNVVTAGDATEDVYQNRFNFLVAEDDFHGV